MSLESCEERTCLNDQPSFRRLLVSLVENDPIFSLLKDDMREFCWPRYASGFEGLARVVAGQQISTRSAQILWGRMSKALYPLTAERFLSCEEDDLAAIGLSRQKRACLRGLAEAFVGRDLTQESLACMDDEEIRQSLTRFKGIGRWSVDMYLIFSLLRENVWPSTDLGICLGLQKYLGLRERPQAQMIEKAGERFVPHRSCAALLLWRLYARRDLKVWEGVEKEQGRRNSYSGEREK